jgi:hypothetical protein
MSFFSSSATATTIQVGLASVRKFLGLGEIDPARGGNFEVRFLISLEIQCSTSLESTENLA